MGYGNDFYAGGRKQVMSVVVPLGAGAVTTLTKIVGRTRRKIRVTAIRFHGQSAVTATALTGEVFARTAAGAAGNTLQAAAGDLDFADADAAKSGIAPALTATGAHLALDEDQLIEVVITADTVNPGPGDLLVEVEYEPRS